MKTLKICRMLSLLSLVACGCLRWVSSSHDNKLELVIVIVAVIALAINQRYLTGRERHPELLSEFSNKGVVIVQAVVALIFLAIGIIYMIHDISSGSDPWQYLSWYSLAAYQIFNTLIEYKIRKEYEAEEK